MKRFFISLLVIVVCCFSGCTRSAHNNLDDGKPRVITTIFPPYDFVRAVAGDAVRLSMLLPPASESHSFEPTPRDIIAIQNADLFIYIGGETDQWVNRILDSMDTRGMTILPLIDTVTAVEEETVEGMAADDDEDAAFDEHIWTSPKNAVLMVQAITEALCKLDGSAAGLYRRNAAAYIAELEKLDADFETAVNGAKRKTVVFGDRFPFRYFTDRYGLSYYAAFPGCSTETEPSVAAVRFLINKIREERIPAVFYIELSNEKMAGSISEATGAKKLLFHSAHNVTKKEFEEGSTYLDIMRANLERLREALY